MSDTFPHASPRRIGQSLELRRRPLADPARRDDAALVRQARAQLASGAQAIDVNAGLDDPDGALIWATAALRAKIPDVELWLDCGDGDALVHALRTLGAAAGPLVVNAALIDAGPERLIEEAALVGASVVLSPRDRNPEVAETAAPAEALLQRIDEGRRLLARVSGLAGAYVDCLAYPAATHAAHCRRSLELIGRLANDRSLRSLVAVGNVSYGAPAALHSPLRRLYAAAAVGAQVDALILPVEDRALIAMLDLLAGVREPANGAETWLRDVASPIEAGQSPPPPHAAALAAEPAFAEAWELLFGGLPHPATSAISATSE